MAVNSLLYLLLTTGLTTSPDGPVTTESPYDTHLRTTKWPGYGEDATISWRQETRYNTEDPSHQFTDAPPVTEQVDPDRYPHPYPSDFKVDPDETVSAERYPYPYGPGEILNAGGCPSQIECTRNCKRKGFKYGLCSGPDNRNCHCYRHWGVDLTEPQPDAELWPFATEEPLNEAERYPYATEKLLNEAKRYPYATEEPLNEAERYPYATEEPVNETERPVIPAQKKGSHSCPQNEHYKRCGTACCPETCFERPPCPSDCCKEGCFCNKGLVRGPAGNCIELEDCPPISKEEKGKRKCPPREHFSKCHKNCEKTCSDYSKPKPCPRSCKKGCVCDGGLVRNNKGKCVPRDQCQKKLMSEAIESRGCSDDILCEVYCITEAGKNSGRCEGKICKCLGK